MILAYLLDSTEPEPEIDKSHLSELVITGQVEEEWDRRVHNR